MRLFHRSRPACCRWVSLDLRDTSSAGRKRCTHTSKHMKKKHLLCLCVVSSHAYSFFFLKAWEEFPFSSLFASLSSINNKAKATLLSQDLVSWASLGFSTLSCLTTPCAINLGVLRIGNLVKNYFIGPRSKVGFHLLVTGWIYFYCYLIQVQAE